jgi:HD-GYP domain-containing protein (c-di-GMP phosphodiesterase class II)
VTHRLPLSDVVASLSYALDLTEGQPQGHSIRACLIGMHIGRAVGLDADSQSHLYYALLLKDAGCSANAAPLAASFGTDDHAVKRALKTTNWSNYVSAAVYMARHAARGGTPWTRLRHMVGLARTGGDKAKEFMRIRCERGAGIVRALGFPEETAEAVRALDEHWDGRGQPVGLRGDEIPLLARIAGLAQTTEVFLQAEGVSGTLEMLLERRGGWFDPALTDVLLDEAGSPVFWRRILAARRPAALSGQEPADRVHWVASSDLDRVAEAFADIIDAKSPYTNRHSRGVAEISRHIGRTLGCPRHDVSVLYRAGLLHDIGKLGISNRILDKPGALTDAEMAEVRLHPRYSMEILSHVAAFSEAAPAAAQHHERLDGSGYPWALTGPQLSLTSRIVAVADVFEALTADRPHRPGMPASRALTLIGEEAGTAFDTDVVSALASWAKAMAPSQWAHAS